MKIYLLSIFTITARAALNHFDKVNSVNGEVDLSVASLRGDDDKSFEMKYPRNQESGVIEICNVEFDSNPHGVLDDNRPCVICSPDHPPCYCDERWHCNYISQTCRSCPTYICLGKNGEIIEGRIGNNNFTNNLPISDSIIDENTLSSPQKRK